MAPDKSSKVGVASIAVPVGMFLLGLLVQGTLYAATVREDIHDLKRDMAEVRCTVAVYTRAPLLPPNCTPGTKGIDNEDQWKTRP